MKIISPPVLNISKKKLKIKFIKFVIKFKTTVPPIQMEIQKIHSELTAEFNRHNKDQTNSVPKENKHLRSLDSVVNIATPHMLLICKCCTPRLNLRQTQKNSKFDEHK